MLDELKIPQEVFELALELDFYLGADFSIFLRLNHRDVKKIHFFSPNFLPEIKFKTKNIHSLFQTIELKIFQFDDFRIYFIRYPYKVISMSNILIDEFFVRVQSMYDDFCVKINMALNSEDKIEFLENISDIFSILTHLGDFDFKSYYLRKYGFEFTKDMFDDLMNMLVSISSEDVEEFLRKNRVYFSFDFPKVSERIFKFLSR